MPHHERVAAPAVQPEGPYPGGPFPTQQHPTPASGHPNTPPACPNQLHTFRDADILAWEANRSAEEHHGPVPDLLIHHLALHMTGSGLSADDEGVAAAPTDLDLVSASQFRTRAQGFSGGGYAAAGRGPGLVDPSFLHTAPSLLQVSPEVQRYTEEMAALIREVSGSGNPGPDTHRSSAGTPSGGSGGASLGHLRGARRPTPSHVKLLERDARSSYEPSLLPSGGASPAAAAGPSAWRPQGAVVGNGPCLASPLPAHRLSHCSETAVPGLAGGGGGSVGSTANGGAPRHVPMCISACGTTNGECLQPAPVRPQSEDSAAVLTPRSRAMVAGGGGHPSLFNKDDTARTLHCVDRSEEDAVSGGHRPGQVSARQDSGLRCDAAIAGECHGERRATSTERPASMLAFDPSSRSSGVPFPPMSLMRALEGLGAAPGKHVFVVVMELCEPGTLLEAINAGDTFSASVRPSHRSRLLALLLTALEVAQGMAYLHSMGLHHGDLKPSHVLLTTSPARPDDMRGFTARLTDFGLTNPADTPGTLTAGSRGEIDNRLLLLPFGRSGSPITDRFPTAEGSMATPNHNDGDDAHVATACTSTPCLKDSFKHRLADGALQYIAPEVLSNQGGDASDVYAFGALLLHMAYGQAPFSGMRSAQVLSALATGSRQRAWPDESSSASPSGRMSRHPSSHLSLDTYAPLRQLGQACLARRPEARPTAEFIVRALARMLAAVRSAGVHLSGPSAALAPQLQRPGSCLTPPRRSSSLSGPWLDD